MDPITVIVATRAARLESAFTTASEPGMGLHAPCGPPVAPQSRLVIEGVRASNVAHIAISILHRSGFRHDPFQHRVDVRDIDLLLEKPPLIFRTDDPTSSD